MKTKFYWNPIFSRSRSTFLSISIGDGASWLSTGGVHGFECENVVMVAKLTFKRKLFHSNIHDYIGNAFFNLRSSKFGQKY